MTRLRRSAFAALGLLAGCEEPAASLGPTQAAARERGPDLLRALALRFGPAAREPSFEHIRPMLLRGSLAPSQVFGDPKAWTSLEGDRRTLEILGRPEPGRYRVGLRPGAPTPQAPGEYRGTIRLRALGKGAYEWSVSDELAVGALRTDDAAQAFDGLLRGVEAAAATQSADLRPTVRKALPRAAAAFGRLYTLEALRARREADGATTVEATVFMDAAALETHAPRYARFLRKYATPIRLEAKARGESGEGPVYWTLDMAERRATLRLRLREGDLVPLDGAPGGVGPQLRVMLDYSTKAGVFRVGVRRLDIDMDLLSTGSETSLTAHFRRGPDWRIPFLVQPFLKGPLRRPFEGDGSMLRYALVEAGPRTLLERSYRLEVKESWIVRWIGSMADAAVSDFRRMAEEESDRFTAACFDALRQDLEALLSWSPSESARSSRSGADPDRS